MLRLTPILLAVLWGLAMYRFSAWRTARELTARSAPLADARIQSLTMQMAHALDLPRINVHVYDIAPVNGLAAPDGRIFLTRGMMEEYAKGAITAQELAGVIAHELGHVALGHGRRRMVDFAGHNALRVGLSMVLGRLIPGLGVVIANGLVTLLAGRVSREDEFEADAYATALLIKSGIGHGPQVSLLSKLDNGPSATPAWLASHPQTADRVAAIERNALNWQ